MATMTEQERRAAAAKLYEDVEETVARLAERWLDERDYEDIADYAELLKPAVEAIGGKLLRMLKRPFGFVYELAGVNYKITLAYNGCYAYKRIA